MPDLSITTEIVTLPKTGRSVQIISLKGSLDRSTYRSFQTVLQNLIDTHNIFLVIDMEGVRYISSIGLGIIMSFMQNARNRSGDVVLYNMKPRIWILFNMLGFTRMIAIYNTLEEALEYLEKIYQKNGSGNVTL